MIKTHGIYRTTYVLCIHETHERATTKRFRIEAEEVREFIEEESLL